MVTYVPSWGYRHRSNGRSQTHGCFMNNDQHQIPDLLSLLTTFYVKVDFFQRLTFWPSLTLEKGQKEQHDFSKNWYTRSRYQKASSLQVSSKSHRRAFSLVSLRYPYINWKSLWLSVKDDGDFMFSKGNQVLIGNMKTNTRAQPALLEGKTPGPFLFYSR